MTADPTNDSQVTLSDSDEDAVEQDAPSEPLPPLHPLFRVVIIVSAAFLVTVLIMLASVFSDGKSPVFVWFNRNAVTVIIVEVVLIIVSSIAAMAVDQKAKSDEPSPDVDE